MRDRSVLLRSAPEKSKLTSMWFCRQAFHAAGPLRMSSGCSAFAGNPPTIKPSECST
jgi:hypothetical protein